MYVKFQRTSCNIVARNVLHTFGHPVATCYKMLLDVGWCWINFENGQILIATFWMLQDVARVWPAPFQHDPTTLQMLRAFD